MWYRLNTICTSLSTDKTQKQKYWVHKIMVLILKARYMENNRFIDFVSHLMCVYTELN